MTEFSLNFVASYFSQLSNEFSYVCLLKLFVIFLRRWESLMTSWNVEDKRYCYFKKKRRNESSERLKVLLSVSQGERLGLYYIQIHPSHPPLLSVAI